MASAAGGVDRLKRYVEVDPKHKTRTKWRSFISGVFASESCRWQRAANKSQKSRRSTCLLTSSTLLHRNACCVSAYLRVKYQSRARGIPLYCATIHNLLIIARAKGRWQRADTQRILFALNKYRRRKPIGFIIIVTAIDGHCNKMEMCEIEILCRQTSSPLCAGDAIPLHKGLPLGSHYHQIIIIIIKWKFILFGAGGRACRLSVRNWLSPILDVGESLNPFDWFLFTCLDFGRQHGEFAYLHWKWSVRIANIKREKKRLTPYFIINFESIAKYSVFKHSGYRYRTVMAWHLN